MDNITGFNTFESLRLSDTTTYIFAGDSLFQHKTNLTVNIKKKRGYRAYRLSYRRLWICEIQYAVDITSAQRLTLCSPFPASLLRTSEKTLQKYSKSEHGFPVRGEKSEKTTNLRTGIGNNEDRLSLCKKVVNGDYMNKITCILITSQSVSGDKRSLDGVFSFEMFHQSIGTTHKGLMIVFADC